MRVLLLSAYDAASHQRWRRALTDGISDWDWTTLTLPPRHFGWRVRGNPLSWHREPVLQKRFDLVLATSMVDLATLRGLLPALAGTPTALYFHENQFAYPEGRGEHGLLEAQMVSLYSAIAADSLLFNSAYNRDSFLAGCRALLKRLPDAVPAGVPDALAEKAQVLPVPVDIVHTGTRGDPGGPLEIVWNHRWEYDKGPELLLTLCEELAESDVGFRMHLVGQQFRERPEAFARVERLLAGIGALGECGFIEDLQRYHQLLSRVDVVLSTARHDFQGLSVIEAVRLGASPVVPDALVYPEWLDAEYRFATGRDAVARLRWLAAQKHKGESLPTPDLQGFDSSNLLPRYRKVLAAMAA